MQGMHRTLRSDAIRHRASRRDQGLGGHLAPEDPKAMLLGAEPPEEVHLERLEIQQVEQFVEGGRHSPILAATEPPIDLR